jgi:large subunit ribosomal protein L18
MANAEKRKQAHRKRRTLSVRHGIRGTGSRPRLSVFRSLKNIYCQVIDDGDGRTLASASSMDKALREALKGLNRTEVAKKVGVEIATRARSAGVTKVAFDRGRFKYHGRVQSLADGAREGGLEF